MRLDSEVTRLKNELKLRAGLWSLLLLLCELYIIVPILPPLLETPFSQTCTKSDASRAELCWAVASANNNDKNRDVQRLI